MKLSELFRRQNETDSSFEELETSLSDLVSLNVTPPLADDLSTSGLAPETPEDVPAAADARPQPEPEPAAVEAEPAPRTTAYTQTRLAEFAAFEKMQNAALQDLETVSASLAKVKFAQHQAREFLNRVHAGIHRTNELELTVAKLTSQNRSLMRHAETVDRLRGQVESLTAGFKRREANLIETADGLRSSLASARLELVEARSAIENLEAERQSMMTALATANSQADRTARENEVLREKNINIAADLDAVSRRRIEAERKLDENLAAHERDAAEIAELRARLASADSERARLQKQNDTLQSRLVDTSEALAAIESDLAEQLKRHDVSMQSLKSERETLLARLDISMKAEQESAEQMAALTSRLHEAVDAERLMSERLAAFLQAERHGGRLEAERSAGGPAGEGQGTGNLADAPEAAIEPPDPADEPRRQLT